MKANKVDTISEAYELAELAQKEIDRRNRILLSDNQKDLRYFTQSEAMEYLNGVEREVLIAHCNKLGLDPKNKDPKAQWLVDMKEIYALRDSLRCEFPDFFPPLFKRLDSQELQVLLFGNQKGGSGKTTSSVTIASFLAAQLHEQYRVLLVDMDPQGTSSMYYASGRNHPDYKHILSFGDYFRGKHIPRIEAGETMKEVVLSSCLDTTIPNLKLICAKESDRGAGTIFGNRCLKGEVERPYAVLKEVLDSVKDEFDIVIIDTPPLLDNLVLNAFNAATTAIVCVSPSENDIDATFNWHIQLPTIFETLDEHGFEGYDNEIKHLFTNVDGKHSSIAEMERFGRVYGTSVLPHYVENSEAIKHCAAQKNTIWDVSKSDYKILGKARTYKKPFETALVKNHGVGAQILKLVKDVWTKQAKVDC